MAAPLTAKRRIVLDPIDLTVPSAPAPAAAKAPEVKTLVPQEPSRQAQRLLCQTFRAAPADWSDAATLKGQSPSPRAAGTTSAPVNAANVTLTYSKNAQRLSPQQEGQVRNLLANAGETGGKINSTTRSTQDQARIMFNNCQQKGAASQQALYKGKPGAKVVDVYEKGLKEGKSPADIQALMQAEIERVGGSTVSNHIREDGGLTVDIDPHSIGNAATFKAKVQADPNVARFLFPPKDPAFHIEFKK